MRRTISAVFSLVAVLSGCSGGGGDGSAVSGVAANRSGGGQVIDISPDPALVLGNASEAFLFLNSRSLLVTSGRPGVHRTDNRGQQWRGAMQGLVDAPTGIEPNASLLCQTPSARSTAYDLGNAINTPVVTTRPYRTDDFGASWRPLAALPGFLVDCAVDPVSPDVLYVLEQSDSDNPTRLFKSMDGGQHFAQVGAGLEQLDAAWHVRVSPFDRNTVYVTDAFTDTDPSLAEGLYVSTDGGLNFTRSATAPANPLSLFFQPAAPGTFFLATWNGQMFRTTDGGATYISPAGLPVTQAQWVAFDPSDPQTNYVAAGAYGLFRSTDGGATYVRTPGPTNDQLGRLGAVDVALPPVAQAGDDDEADDDGGSSRSIYISTSFGPFRSDDGANTFKPIQRGYRGATVNDLELDASGRLMVGVFHTLQLFRGARPGQPEPYEQTGARMTPGGDTVAVAGSPADSNVLLVANFGDGVWRTADGGASWTRATMPVLGLNPFTRMTFAPSNANRVYLVSRCCGFFRSDDGGISFTQTQPAPRRWGAVAADPTNADVVYVGAFPAPNQNQHGLFKSIDGGATFGTALPGSEGKDFAQIVIDPSNPSTLYAACRQGGVYRSTDGGAHWSLAGSLPSGETLGVVLDPQALTHVFAWVQGQGVFRSNDSAATWAAVETDVSVRKSGAEAGRAGMAADPVFSGRVYIGNAGVVQIDSGR